MLESDQIPLGKVTPIPQTLDASVLARVINMHHADDYLARFVCPELTSLCPVTGQPDFCHLIIDYVPGLWLIESKSLKLFLFSFRNHRGFHEDCSLTIGKELIKLVGPKWLRISAYWWARGGIPIEVFFEKGELPESVVVPDTGVVPYRGRG